MVNLLRLYVLTASIVCASFAPAAAAHEHFPNSSWSLDMVHSNLGAGPRVRSDIVSLTIDNDREFYYAEVAVGASGKVTRLWWHGPPDGSLHPMHGMLGALAGFSAADDSGHFIYPNGMSASNWFWASPDRKTLTYKVFGFSKDGKSFRQTLIYHRIFRSPNTKS